MQTTAVCGAEGGYGETPPPPPSSHSLQPPTPLLPVIAPCGEAPDAKNNVSQVRASQETGHPWLLAHGFVSGSFHTVCLPAAHAEAGLQV